MSLPRYTILSTFLLFQQAVAQCPLCMDGSDPPLGLSFAPPEWEGRTCGDVLQDAQNSQSPCDEWIQQGFYCGCPLPPEGGGCPLCFDGSLPPDPLAMPPDFNGLTCNTVRAVAATPGTENLTCDEWLQAGLLCGCPRRDDECTLCEDGSELPDMERTEGLQTCAVLAAFAAFSSGETCRAWRASLGVYCGCDNPIASEGYCRVCGGAKLLEDSNAVAFVNEEGDGVSCGEVELNESNMDCETLQKDYSVICCPSPSPTEMSTEMPVEASAVATASPVTNSSSVEDTLAPTASEKVSTSPPTSTSTTPAPVDSLPTNEELTPPPVNDRDIPEQPTSSPSHASRWTIGWLTPGCIIGGMELIALL